MKAITTKFIGPTNTKGSRIKAQAYKGKGGTLLMPFDYDLDAGDNHNKAAELLAKKLGWNVILQDGYAEHLEIGVHVIVGRK